MSSEIAFFSISFWPSSTPSGFLRRTELLGSTELLASRRLTRHVRYKTDDAEVRREIERIGGSPATSRRSLT